MSSAQLPLRNKTKGPFCVTGEVGTGESLCPAAVVAAERTFSPLAV